MNCKACTVFGEILINPSPQVTVIRQYNMLRVISPSPAVCRQKEKAQPGARLWGVENPLVKP